MIYNKKRVKLISAILGFAISILTIYFGNSTIESFFNSQNFASPPYLEKDSTWLEILEFLTYNLIFFIMVFSLMLITIYTLEYFKIMTRNGLTPDVIQPTKKRPSTPTKDVEEEELLKTSPETSKIEPDLSVATESNDYVSNFTEDPSEDLSKEDNRTNSKVGITASLVKKELTPATILAKERHQESLNQSSYTVIPDWFDGTIPEEGIAIVNTENKSKIYLNPIETAIYHLAESCNELLADLYKSVDKGEADKVILQAPMYLDLENQLMKAKQWLKENKIEAYDILFRP